MSLYSVQFSAFMMDAKCASSTILTSFLMCTALLLVKKYQNVECGVYQFHSSGFETRSRADNLLG